MEQNILLNRRANDRYSTNIRAQYFIKNQSERYQECTIINISRSGLALEYPEDEEFKIGSIVFLEIFIPAGLTPVNVTGEIKRLEPDKSICGVKFSEMLSNDIINKLY
jgi:hypothetical protein